MISSSAIKSTPGNAAKYYAQGDYYTKGEEEPSAWAGKGAERLGLGGDGEGVSQKDLQKILEGKLGAGQKVTWTAGGETNRAHRPGWDFTVSAPKSVSVAALVGGDQRIIDAHEKAVDEALSFLERYAVARVKEKGVVTHKLTNNLLAAKFQEFTSRAEEANLHTHVVIANATFDEDKTVWRSLDYDGLEKAKKTADQIYKNALAHDLRQKGLDIVADEKTGSFEIAGVSTALISAHSSRSKQIKAYVEKSGDDTSAGKLKATLETRPNKTSTSFAKISAEWRGRAGAEIEPLQTLIEASKARSVDPSYQQSVERRDENAEHAFRFGAAHATASEAVVDRAEIIKHALRISVGETTRDDVERIAAAALEAKDLNKAVRHTGGKRLYYGTYLGKDLAAERLFQKVLQNGQDRLRPLLRPKTAQTRLDKFRIHVREDNKSVSYALSDEQRDAARAILQSKDRIQHVQGVGGAGKTAFVGAIARATPLRDHLAIAKTAVAAKNVGEEAGLRHLTVDAFLQRGGKDIAAGGVLFIDEASMIGTRAAARIDQLAAKNHFRVVVIGDERQIPAIEQGKPHALARKFGATTAELTQSRRHKTAEVQRSVTAAREGRVKEALNAADEVHTLDYKRIPKAAADHWTGLEGRDKSKVLVLDNKTRVATAAHIRDNLIEEGAVARAGVATEILSNKSISEAEKKRSLQYPRKDAAVIFHKGQRRHKIEPGTAYDIVGADASHVYLERRFADTSNKSPEKVKLAPARDSVAGLSLYDVQQREVAVGDKIQYRRNTPALDLKNGDQGVVLALNGRKAEVLFDGKTKPATIDLDKDQHYDYSYALTLHKGQGGTFDRSIVVAPARRSDILTQDTFYTAVSRARYGIDIFTDDQKKLITILTQEKGGKTSTLEAANAIAAPASDKTVKDGARRPDKGDPKEVPPPQDPSGRQAPPGPSEAKDPLIGLGADDPSKPPDKSHERHEARDTAASDKDADKDRDQETGLNDQLKKAEKEVKDTVQDILRDQEKER